MGSGRPSQITLTPHAAFLSCRETVKYYECSPGGCASARKVLKITAEVLRDVEQQFNPIPARLKLALQLGEWWLEMFPVPLGNRERRRRVDDPLLEEWGNPREAARDGAELGKESVADGGGRLWAPPPLPAEVLTVRVLGVALPMFANLRVLSIDNGSVCLREALGFRGIATILGATRSRQFDGLIQAEWVVTGNEDISSLVPGACENLELLSVSAALWRLQRDFTNLAPRAPSLRKVVMCENPKATDHDIADLLTSFPGLEEAYLQ
ncbi:hypothetical protein BDK51DRAFT_41926 [Blyttiomyces helicus]|uniref:Uncharacterized protein n=1 Tax=Blyttiomyces helicus TaxID=388810 RepID=A0A4P9W225_9FUNG|nr:hypothetical protein BDK51DRAFT_41926 [Blyttiomyces helicus]|eukprot:RKO84126.1 hypothetical protein BDK51DRAFT_41926 [Blyttiomyces helicus]